MKCLNASLAHNLQSEYNEIMREYDLEHKKKKIEREEKNKKRGKHKMSFFLLLFSVLILAGISAAFIMKTVGNAEKTSAWKPVSAQKEETGENLKWQTVPETIQETATLANETGTDNEEESSTASKNTYGKIETKQLADKADLTFLFAGDLLLDDSYSPMIRLKARKNGILDCFSEDTIQMMQGADVFMLNNEFPYTDRGTPTQGKKYTFHAKPENVKILDQLGVDMVALANNHAYDYGEVSLLDTLDTLNNDNMLYAGAGHNLTEASAPVVFQNQNIKIAIFCSTQIERLNNPDTKGATENSPGVFRCWQNDLLVNDIKKAKDQYDFVIVYVHWGTESTTEVDTFQKQLAQQLADAGAGMVIGDHPHVLQGITCIGQTPIIYSLGNYWFNSVTTDTGMLQLTLENKKLKTLRFIPARQSNCYTQILSGNDKSNAIKNMQQISSGVTIDDDGTVHY